MSNLNLNTVTSLDTGREVDVHRVMQAVDYVGGLIIDSLDTVIVDGDDRYVLSVSTSLPYTTTGGGMPEGGAFVCVGDAVLRQDLANPDKGAALVARGVVAVDSIADLLALPEGQRKEDLRYLVKEHHAGTGVGGGEFYWSESTPASSHDGGHYISFQKAIPTDWSSSSTVEEWFTAPTSGSGVFVRYRESLSADIQCESFGALANSDIDHAPIFSAIYRANTARSEVILGRGVFRTSAPFTVRNGSKLRGVNRTETTIEGMGDGNTCVRLANSGTGRTFNCRVYSLGVRNPLSFTGKSLDFDGASYCHFEDLQAGIIGGAGGSGGPTAWAEGTGISIVRGGALFNGYIAMKDCYVTHHRFGLVASVNDMVIQGGSFNQNGQLGIDITGGAAYTILSAEISGNGAENDPDNHGGCRFAGEGLFSSGVWNEYNRSAFPKAYSPNNWITKPGRNVTILPGRIDISNTGVYAAGFEGNPGVQYGESIGTGNTSTQGMIRNGNFAIRGADNTPLGWAVTGEGTFNTDAGVQSKLGYGSGVKFTRVSGVPKLFHRILTSSEVSQYRGQTIQALWVFMIPEGVSLDSGDRIGIWIRDSGALSRGAFANLSNFPTGEVIQYTAQYKISDELADTPYHIDAAVQLASGEVTLFGCAVSFGPVPWLNFNRPVTDAGGTVYGPLQLDGPVTLPTHADNEAAVSRGLAVGRMYKTSAGEVKVVV